MNENKCFYCGGKIDFDDDFVFCPTCGENYHTTCYQMNSGCTNPMCGSYKFTSIEEEMEQQTDVDYLEEQTYVQSQEETTYISTDNLTKKRFVLLISLCATIAFAILGAVFVAISAVFGSGILFIIFLLPAILFFVCAGISAIIMFVFFNLSMGITITSQRVIIEDPFKMEKSIPLDLITSSTGKPGFVKIFALNTASSIPFIVLFHSQSKDYYDILKSLIVERKSNKQ